MVVLLGLLSIVLVPLVTVASWWAVWVAEPRRADIAHRTLGVALLGFGVQFAECWILSPALVVSGLSSLIVGCFWKPRHRA